MASKKDALKKQVLAEVERLPVEYYPLLLELLRTYRDSVTLGSAAASFNRGWQEARRGEMFPVDQLSHQSRRPLVKDRKRRRDRSGNQKDYPGQQQVN